MRISGCEASEFFTYCHSLTPGTVVHNDDLDRAVGLRQNTGNGFAQEIAAIVYRDDCADETIHLHSHYVLGANLDAARKCCPTILLAALRARLAVDVFLVEAASIILLPLISPAIKAT